MATVRLSKELLYDVTNAMQTTFEVRERQLRERFVIDIRPDDLARDARAWMLECAGVTEDFVAKIPKSWLSGLSYTAAVSTINDQLLPTVLTLRFDPPLPAALPKIGGASRFAPYVTVAKKYRDEADELGNEKRAAIRALNRIFEQCGTLRQALEAWPGIMELLPKRVVDAHNAPAEKRSAGGAALAVETVELLNGAVVKSKIAQATAQ
jgi:hypothetical protein